MKKKEIIKKLKGLKGQIVVFQTEKGGALREVVEMSSDKVDLSHHKKLKRAVVVKLY